MAEVLICLFDCLFKFMLKLFSSFPDIASCVDLFLLFFTGIVVTNDGNAILRELDIAHPAAKVPSIFCLTQSASANAIYSCAFVSILSFFADFLCLMICLPVGSQ